MKYLLLSILLLAGCSQTPTQFIVAPGQTLNAGDNMLASQLDVQDQRAHPYLITTMPNQEPVKTVNSNTSPIDVIRNSLAARLSAKRIRLNGANYRVNINQLGNEIEQSLFKFINNSKLELEVVIGNQSGTLEKTFKRHGNSYGPFRADLVVIERDFNILLGQMLDDIANDQELTTFLSQ